jgi:3-methyladenine DNA glycosylase/8-oxoguanine DNA glycosylase
VIGYPPGYDFQRSTFRFRRFGDDLASRWIDGGLHRVLRSGLPVRITGAGVQAYGDPGPGDAAELRHVLGFEFDAAGLAAAHPDIAAVAPGFLPPLMADPFEMLVTSVTAQQVSLHSACAMRNRLVRRFGTRIVEEGREWWAFPRPSGVDPGDLEGLGLSGAKIRSIRALVAADLDLTGADDTLIRARLTALPGIGPWTVDWFLARCLGRPDAFAAGDLGVRKAVARWYSNGTDLIWPQEWVREACTPLGRHANLAVHHLLTLLA